ncbi:RecQ family ATP-dependent DNA helicase [Vibrio nitrifigilis]|uniref:ATP-dependent DNA helicase RecQ n=1 Tax=Vibrio nitrifigilis TaxID=2789781 RepID=A0ABS0GE28_9VIBR|nr:ATP-dependent DNA helicase RecQ [Vibrio nitrifigilis]MBF9000620.1 RecQ family ATP-dependent DNA helicase [Vibrio nitrifigilis]
MIEQTLKQYFGFDSLRPGQNEVIQHVVNGQSAAAIFPTGSGKSMCYQLPALQLPHLTLVISPLLALMKDQLDFLHSKGIAAASIDSTQDRATTQAVMQQVRNGELKILMISVERLKNERFREFISHVPISLLVVDEAHCISEWGHNFRPDYLKLPEYRQLLNIPQVLLLTATATPQVIEDMCHKFAISKDAITVTGFYRNNLELDVIPCREQDKLNQLIHLIQDDTQAPTIVYVTLQKTAERVAQQLANTGVKALAYHAGLKSDVREDIQRRFMIGESNCIVATIAFGMGIDKSDIRRVIHFDLPKSIENYSQEIGRAGRDGLPSRCITLANTDHVNVLENFVYGDTPDKSSIATVVDEIYASGAQWEVMMNSLSRESNIRQLPLKTLLVYLELNQVIRSQYSYFANYRFKFIETAEAIIHRFQGERRSFVEAIFQCSVRAKTWSTVDFDALWMGHQAERKRVVAAIDYFHEQGWIELESKQVTDVYQVLNTQIPKSELVERLYHLFTQKEHSEIERIQAMLGYFESEQCLSYTLASYFSDDKAPRQCGHCSVCSGRVAKLARETLPDIDVNQVQQWVQPLFVAASDEPLSAKAVSRFLCGISNPLITKLKASKMDGFGQLERYPFAEVNQIVEQLMS